MKTFWIIFILTIVSFGIIIPVLALEDIWITDTDTQTTKHCIKIGTGPTATVICD